MGKLPTSVGENLSTAMFAGSKQAPPERSSDLVRTGLGVGAVSPPVRTPSRDLSSRP